MSIDPNFWMQYARENLAVAELCQQAGHLNACLQNAQQCVEKSLKAIRAYHRLGEKKSHHIGTLQRDLFDIKVDVGLSREDCELLDSIYVDSKYPTPSVVPHSPPDQAICRRCVELARTVVEKADIIMEAK